jgi:hypothetical protein
MTLYLTVKCNGHRSGQDCRGGRTHPLELTLSTARYSPAPTLPETVVDGWRTLPNGGDLCPSPGHDEDLPDSHDVVADALVRQRP